MGYLKAAISHAAALVVPEVAAPYVLATTSAEPATQFATVVDVSVVAEVDVADLGANFSAVVAFTFVECSGFCCQIRLDQILLMIVVLMQSSQKLAIVVEAVVPFEAVAVLVAGSYAVNKHKSV